MIGSSFFVGTSDSLYSLFISSCVTSNCGRDYDSSDVDDDVLDDIGATWDWRAPANVQKVRDFGLHCHVPYTNIEELHRVGTGVRQFALRRNDVQTVVTFPCIV